MKIIVAGDYCPQNRLSGLCDSNGNIYDVIDERIVNRLKKADLSIVNLEAPIRKGSASPIKKSGPNLCANENSIIFIKKCGFNMVTLANNHLRDYGDDSVIHTMEKLEEAHIEYVGAGRNLTDANRTLYKKIGDKTVAVINACEEEYSIATETTPGSNPLRPIRQYYQILEAKKKADFILVITHGGIEHFQYPTSEMINKYRFFIDAGASAVVNHHQHCYSGYEIYKGKPIFYGLGNFCFDHTRKRNDIWNKGFIVDFNIEEELKFEILPYTQCNEEANVNLLPEYEVLEFKKEISDINRIINDEKKLRKEIDRFEDRTGDFYLQGVMPNFGRFDRIPLFRKLASIFFSKSQIRFLFDIVNCESHRTRFLQKLNESI